MSQKTAITIIVTPQATLITISRQAEVVVGERTLYQAKVLEALEEVAVEEVTTAAAAEMKVEVTAATNFLLIPMFVY